MEGKRFKFGDSIVSIIKGSKNQGDYCLLWDGHQFKDIDLFKELKKIYTSLDKFAALFDYLRGFEGLRLEEDAVKINKLNNLYEYVLKLPIDNEEQMIIFSIIHRCNIDNLNYPPPRFNGAIRHISQIFILFGLIFKIKLLIPAKLLSEEKDPVLIANEIGFPNNSYGFTKEDFKEIYTKGINQSIVF